ncbi:glycosyltransferase family 4 protein [Kluyvera cryocrescens]|uniref:glycosyltransferase family 4 protein n=1 Tax=Kluyvera cryocrescens TaxID=580 RepID=UPI0039F4ABA7
MNELKHRRKVSVIIPAEENISLETGGAIASWVYEVYKNNSENFYRTIYTSKASSSLSLDDIKIIKLFYIYKLLLEKIIFILSFFMKINAHSFFRVNGFIFIKLLPSTFLLSDIVHIHNRPYYAKWIRRRGYKGKIILHMHNDISNYVKTSELNILDMIDEFWFCSNAMMEKAKLIFGIKNTHCVYNGTHIHAVTPNSIGKTLKLIIAGRIIEEKGILQSIKICELLNEAGISTHLSICGSTGSGGDNKNTSYYESVKFETDRVNKKFNMNLVSLKGHLSKNDLYNEMKLSNIFLFPCQWEEPFGMVIIESLGSGTPVIASKKGGIPEIINDGYNGYLIEDSKCLTLFVERIIFLKNSPDLYKRMQQYSIANVKNKFSWGEIRKQVNSLL